MGKGLSFSKLSPYNRNLSLFSATFLKSLFKKLESHSIDSLKEQLLQWETSCTKLNVCPQAKQPPTSFSIETPQEGLLSPW